MRTHPLDKIADPLKLACWLTFWAFCISEFADCSFALKRIELENKRACEAEGLGR